MASDPFLLPAVQVSTDYLGVVRPGGSQRGSQGGHVHGSGGRFCGLANLCDLPAWTRSLILGRLGSFRVYSGSWILPCDRPHRAGDGPRPVPGRFPAWPLSSDRSVRRGSRVKRDFACTFTRHFPPVLVGLRSQSRLRPEGRARTLSGPSPDVSPARTMASSARMPTAGFCLRSAYRSRSDAGGALDRFRLP